MKTSRYIGYFGIMFLILSCDESPTESSPSITIPDVDEVCDNQYSEVDGSLISCDSDCSLYGNDCYHDYDIQLLSEIKENNESLNETILLDIGSQIWTNGRLTELNISNLELTYIPENLCNLDCQINVSNNQLCQEYQFDCINTWGTQSGLESMDECGLCLGESLCNDGHVQLLCDCYNIETTTTLSLEFNQLTGEIPVEIGNFTNLTQLYLNNNQLTGEIPVEIGNLTNLQYLYLQGNQLTGEIPSSIGNLTNLQYLRLYDNQLTGEIPIEIGNLTNLEYLNLRDNQLTGEIPSEIGNLTNLTTLWLWGNNLSGEIPSVLGNLTNLGNLWLSDNQLTGEIPIEICNQGDSTPSLGNNKLCPPYPSCISQEDIDSQDTSNCP